MRLNRLAAALVGALALAAASPAVAQSTTKRAPDASATTAGSENMKPRHEFDPYSTGSTPKALPDRSRDVRRSETTVRRFDRMPSSTDQSSPN